MESPAWAVMSADPYAYWVFRGCCKPDELVCVALAPMESANLASKAYAVVGLRLARESPPADRASLWVPACMVPSNRVAVCVTQDGWRVMVRVSPEG